ncbi:MAG: hypothetical protein K1060chlam5_00968 [Candidatus Anoxychlamydiales bacterium]|nr:hypothetical protein [Candidatus Anoxychlamydiales bacterium]
MNVFICNHPTIIQYYENLETDDFRIHFVPKKSDKKVSPTDIMYNDEI